ncbi:MAG: acyl-CoA dehydrogenase family protein [Burkholderiales bacterium]|nr:acyl-CoA dehydrogenase family protein [Burkholderiales bacterium]
MSEQHELIRESVRRFAEKEIAPISEELWEEQGFAYDIWKQAGELGFLGLPYPEQYGGGGGDWLGFTIVLEEVARVDAAVASSLMANSTPASLINNFGTDAQKQRYLRPILVGSQIGCIGLTEPNAGSDAANIQTRAVMRDGQWIINGSKTFITNSGTDITGPVVIAAVTGTRPDGRKEISNFILPSGTPGFSHGRKLRKIGWRGSTTYELYFEDCRLPADHLLGEQGAGLKQTLSNISTGRILIGALGLGILQGSLERSVAYMKDQPCDVQASMAKLFSTEKAMEAAHQAIQIHGGNGIMAEYPVSRAFGDAKVLEIVEGASEIQRMIISRDVLR